MRFKGFLNLAVPCGVDNAFAPKVPIHGARVSNSFRQRTGLQSRARFVSSLQAPFGRLQNTLFKALFEQALATRSGLKSFSFLDKSSFFLFGA